MLREVDTTIVMVVGSLYMYDMECVARRVTLGKRNRKVSKIGKVFATMSVITSRYN